MKQLVLALGVMFLISSIAKAEIRTQQVEYRDKDTVLEGFLAYDDANQEVRPAVLVMPEWWGLTDYPKHRAEELAKMGYVAFVADIYGKGVTTENPQEAGALATPFYKDRKLTRQRAQAALDTLLGQKYVDKSRVAVIGYCFGGMVALELARSGAPLVGLVTFHGSLSRSANEGPDNIKAKILICHGAADPHVPPQELADFEKEMVETKSNYQINIYGGAMHAFTNPAADSHHLPGIAYNEQADHRSWNALKDFFTEVFSQP
jgi:dienelactone hydrolase